MDTVHTGKTTPDLVAIYDNYDNESCLQLLRGLHSKELSEVEKYLLSEMYSLLYSTHNPNEALLLQKRLIKAVLRKIEKQERLIKSLTKQQ